LALADTNGDGVLDVATANSRTQDVSLLPGFSDGTFQMPTDQGYIQQAYKDLLGRPVDTPSFNAFLGLLAQQENVRLVGPRGTTVPLSILVNTTSNNTVYNLTFAPQTPDGTYTLFIGPDTLGTNIKDFVGNSQPGPFTGLIAINTSDDGRFVTGMYHDLLGRAADTPGFVSFLSLVDTPRFQALQSFAIAYVRSVESLSNFVRRLYDGSDPGANGSYLLPIANLLNRPASPAEVNAWVQALLSGVTEDQVIAGLVASDEYFNNPTKGNGSNATWVNSIWLDLLGRPVGTGETWALQGLNAGTFTRAQVAAIVVSSDEYHSRIIRGTYVALLGRIPQAADIASWLPLVRQGSSGPGVPTPDQRFVAALLGSNEFFYRLGNTNSSWLSSLYTVLLGRAPDVAGYTGTLNVLLNSYVSQRQLASQILDTSSEYRARLITGYYETYVRRAPSSGEIAAWISFMQGGGTDQQIIAALVSSAEYFQGQASNDNTQYVDHLYSDLLLRSADSGAQTFINFLNGQPPSQQAVARNQVALTLLGSVEYRRDLIATYFNTFLGRNKPVPVPTSPADPDPELDPWVNLLGAGFTDETIISFFLGTPEYFNRTKPPLVFP
jgi:hypothetical protein